MFMSQGVLARSCWSCIIGIMYLMIDDVTWAAELEAQRHNTPGFVAMPLVKSYNLKSPELDPPNSLFANGGALYGDIRPDTTKLFHALNLSIELDDYGYMGTILIGTPPREFKLLVDSGSVYLWVPGEGCEAGDGSGNCGNHASLGSKSSSSFADTGEDWIVTYGSGPVSGRIVTDHVSIAGLTLKSHRFGIALKESKHYTLNETLYDGIMGLGRSTSWNKHTPSLVEALHDAALIDKQIVSYKIPRAADGKSDGELAFGGMNPAKYKQDTVVTLNNISPMRFWEAPMDSVVMNGVTMKFGPRSAILDSGTTYILGPRKDIAMLHTAIPGSRYDDGLWFMPCYTEAVLSLVFGGRVFTIQPRDLHENLRDRSDPGSECRSRVGEMRGSPGSRWIVGDVFLKNVYFSTNLDSNEISLAELL